MKANRVAIGLRFKAKEKTIRNMKQVVKTLIVGVLKILLGSAK